MGLGLYEHQRKALNSMRSGSVLCGGVGSGKSRTALAFFIKKICNGKLPSASSKGQVEVREIVPLYIITTARKRDTADWVMEGAPFGLSLSDDSICPMQIDSWNNIEKYKDVSNAFFIFDEQRVVSTGKWAMTFVKIAKRNRWILLSATPGDTWIDYWAVFVANGYYKNITDFRRQHVVYKRMAKFPQIERYVDTWKLEKLRNHILVPMDFKRQAVRHYEWIKVGYDKATYDIAWKKRWNVFEDRPLENISEVCHILRKITNSDSKRLIAVDNVLSKKPRVIIFYNYDYELEMLRSYLDEKKLDYGEWNGHRHQPLPSSNRWVYLVQYIAGSEGWNCIETNTIIFFSLNYSYKLTEQACGRIDRLNTPYTDLYYFHIFSDAPIDKAIKSCLKRKKTFNEKAFFARENSR